MPLAAIRRCRMDLGMKLNAALAKSLLMAASIGVVVPVLAQTQTQPKAPATKTPPPKTAQPKDKAATKAARPAEKDPEPEPVIPGITVARQSGGGYLGITLENNKFKVSFYDSKKKPVAIDMGRANLRWNPVNKSGSEHLVLNPTPDNLALFSERIVQRPHHFKLYLTLLPVTEGGSTESYVVDIRG